MKKIFYILLFLPLSIIGQETIAPEMFQTYINTGSNETFMFAQGYIDVFQSEQTMNGVLAAFYDLNGDGEIGYYNSYNGMFIPECVGYTNIIQGNQTSLAVWGDDTTTDEIDGLPCGEVPIFYFLSELNVIYEVQLSGFNAGTTQIEGQLYTCGDPESDYYCEYIGYGYCTNDLLVPENISLLCQTDIDEDGICDEYVILGCMDSLYVEYSSIVNTNDESCSTLVEVGCMDSLAYNYDALANTIGDCIVVVVVEGCMNSISSLYDSAANVQDASCEYIGCMDEVFDTYDSNANVHNDASCGNYGCTYYWAFNYDSTATLDNASCEPFIFGCIDASAFNYNVDANTDNGSCIAVILGCTDISAINYNEFANTSVYEYCEYDQTGGGYCALPNPYEGNTGANMTIILTPAFVSSLNISEENAYLVALTSEGMVVGTVNLFGLSQTMLAIWGDDTCTENLDGALAGEIISFQMVYGTSLFNVEMPTPVSYTTNGMIPQISAATLTDACLIYICSDPNYLEYYFNPTGIDLENANTEELCSTPITITGLTSDMFTDPINTGANMTLPMPGGLLEQFAGGQIAAFMGDICVGLESITTGFIAMGLWGDDSSTELIDGLLVGEVPTFAVLYNGGVISLDQNEMTGYQTNGIAPISNFQFTEPIGCTNPAACNYLSYALIDDGSCILPIEFYNCNNSCINDTDNDGICDELEIPGCTEWGYNNYNELATDNDGSCTVSWQEDYTSLSLSSNTIIDSIETDYTNYITNSTATIDSLQAAYDQLDGLSISIDLLLGWNIIGYTNSYEQDAEEALFAIEDLIEVFKDNNADVYMPEYGFNGIGNLVPGQGYQIKVSEAYNSFSFENTPIFGCTNENSINYNPIALIDDGTCITIVYGCTDPWSENYNPYATMNDGSCFYYMCYDPFCGTPPISFDPWCQWMLNDFSTDPTFLIDGYEFNDYIDEASQNDGAIYGCTDPEAFNYNSSANSYDGTCTYP